MTENTSTENIKIQHISNSLVTVFLGVCLVGVGYFFFSPDDYVLLGVFSWQMVVVASGILILLVGILDKLIRPKADENKLISMDVLYWTFTLVAILPVAFIVDTAFVEDYSTAGLGGLALIPFLIVSSFYLLFWILITTFDLTHKIIAMLREWRKGESLSCV